MNEENSISSISLPREDRSTAVIVLDSAKATVMSERGNQHGNAQSTFDSIGAMWSVYLAGRYPKHNVPIMSAYDVAQMMVLLKVVRASQGDIKHHDHYVDAAGYSALAAMLGEIK